MWTYFHIKASHKEESNLDPHKTNVLFLSAPGEKATPIQGALSNLSEMEETLESPYDKGLMERIKKLLS